MNQAANDTTPTSNFLTLGLDIGIASVGWAVLSKTRIVDIGVRCFDKAETAKEGESLNLARRHARLLRRRLYRRSWRMTKLGRMLKQEGLIDNAAFFKQQPSASISSWQLRAEGLERLLSAQEWARVIYHLCKHRGFHWASKAEEVQAEGDAKGEGGRVKKGLADTAAKMAAKGYRSAAEMVLAEFPHAQRNKRGEYDKALSRVLLDQEFALLFEEQRRLGNPYASAEFEQRVRGNGDRKSGLFWNQKPALAGDDLLKMLGHCTFEKTEFRAPKASFTAERHVWLTRLNNLRLVVDGASRPLTQDERTVALLLPYQTEQFKYKTLKTALVKAGHIPDSARFGGLAYPSEAQKETGKTKDPEDQVVVKLPAWHDLRKALSKAGLQDAWQQISVAALDGQPQWLDSIGWVLSVYKDDTEVERELATLALPQAQAVIPVLLGLRFDKFHALSLKALRQIVPHMERGLRYDEAVAQIPAYGHHSQRVVLGTGTRRYLPSFYKNERSEQGSMMFRDDIDVPRNPVVLRALNQARKVVNAVIKKHGSLSAVHIEMARDLSRPLDERREVKKLQEEFRDRNDKARESFESDHGYRPKGIVFLKWMLYREQQGKCAYSLGGLDIDRVLNDANYAQIDHALPYSRSYDDSKNNKVLVLTRENQNKGNRTAYEYLTSFAGGEDGDRWRNYAAWVNGNKSYRMAKRNRLLRKNYGAEEASGFKDRNLNDTRYICKFFKNYVEEHLQLAPRADGNANKRCVVVNGQLTAFLRARWGLSKVRSESDRHHALDAAVVAACSHGMVKALADYARNKEVAYLREGFPDPETGEIINPEAHARGVLHFPEPWAHFRHELQARLYTDDPQALREDLQRLGTYAEQDLLGVRTLFVSRAVQHRGTPPLHEATIRSAKRLDSAKSYVRTPLTKLKTAMLPSIIESHGRNKALVEALAERLRVFDDDPVKAFATPMYKPSAPGKVAPRVVSVKILTTQKNGFLVQSGVADLGEMLGVDVYKLEEGFLIDPIYPTPSAKRVAAKELPKSAVLQFRLTKNELIRVRTSNSTTVGYFVMYETDGRATLRAHDQPVVDKKFFRRSIASASEIRKLNVDVLGHIYDIEQ